MAKKKRQVVTPDKIDLAMLANAIKSQGNAIPPAIATVIRLVAPILVRLAIRYVARKYRKKISDVAINTASKWIGDKIDDIIAKSAEK